MLFFYRNRKTFCCLCCKSGPLATRIHTNKQGYVPGNKTIQIFQSQEYVTKDLGTARAVPLGIHTCQL